MKKDKKALRKHIEEMRMLYSENTKHPESAFDFVEEAAVHLLEHYETPFKKDYVFLMGKALFGKHRATGDTACGMVLYADGDLHEFAHDLCDEMREQPDLATMIIHAVELHLGRKVR